MNAAYRWCLSAVCVLAIAVLYGDAMYRYGVEHGQKVPRVCAKVMGMTPVYSTADECTYIMGTQGRAYWMYLAVKEGRK